jgi:hypothetical protein
MKSHHDLIGDRIIAGLLQYACLNNQISFQQVYTIFCRRTPTDWREMLLQAGGCESTAALFYDPNRIQAQSFYKHAVQQADRQFSLKEFSNNQDSFFEKFSEFNH